MTVQCNMHIMYVKFNIVSFHLSFLKGYKLLLVGFADSHSLERIFQKKSHLEGGLISDK